jgi:agmatinase
MVAESVERLVGEWREHGKIVVTLAGEHTGVVGAIRAHARSPARLTVLQLDAHSDLRDRYQGDPWNHACTMARVLDFHDDIVQVGIRSESLEDRALADRRGVRTFPAAGLHADADRGSDWIAPILDACAESVYVTLDCDVLDPSVMPATGTPEPGGLDWRQVNGLLDRLCRARRVVGFDVSELAPIAGIGHPQFAIAKLIARFMGWMGASAARAAAERPAAAAEIAVRVGATTVGRGLFVTRDFAEGEEILVFTGKEIDFAGSLAKGDRECDAFQIGPDRYLDLDPPGVFINHSCDPNTGVRDGVRLVALGDLRSGEEIRYDYSTTMDEDHWTMECRCGSRRCRGVIRDFKWLPNDVKRELLRRDVVPSFLAGSRPESARASARATP